MVFLIVLAVATLKIVCTVITLKTIINWNRMGFMVIFNQPEGILNVALLLSLTVHNHYYYIYNHDESIREIVKYC